MVGSLHELKKSIGSLVQGKNGNSKKEVEEQKEEEEEPVKETIFTL